MKILFLAISFLAISTSSFAGGNKNLTMTAEKRLDVTIQNQVSYPSFLTEKPGEYIAEVHFKVNVDGTIIVKDVVTTEEDLKENVLDQVRNFSVSTEGLNLNDNYKVVIRFSTL